MNIGVAMPLPDYNVDIALVVHKAEELGLESFCCAEHPFIPVPEPAAFPARRMRSFPKATPILSIPSSPWCGSQVSPIGAGWVREETEIMGGDFDHRGSQVRESILATKELRTKPERAAAVGQDRAGDGDGARTHRRSRAAIV